VVLILNKTEKCSTEKKFKKTEKKELQLDFYTTPYSNSFKKSLTANPATDFTSQPSSLSKNLPSHCLANLPNGINTLRNQ